MTGPVGLNTNIKKLIGRSGEIRTPDPLLPKQVRYQAALRSARPMRSKTTRHGQFGVWDMDWKNGALWTPSASL